MANIKQARKHFNSRQSSGIDRVLEMPKTNAENCRAYYYRNKNKSVKNKCSPQTNAELCRANTLQEQVGKSFVNMILCTAPTTNSSSQVITTVPSLSSVECDNINGINVQADGENSPVLYYQRNTLKDIISTKSEQSPRSQAQENNQSILSNQDIVLDRKRHSENQEVIMDQKQQSDIPNVDKVDKNTDTETEDYRRDKKTKGKPSIKSKLSSKPLLPVKFLKSCKKNLVEMTREELEEFCILKIVESVVDRTNLKEMNLQLKSMACNIEYCKKRTNLLIKQNRILKVVLKSVEDEYKKDFEETEGPLKISRSVGIQVLMEETLSRRKYMTPNKSHNQNQNYQEYTAPNSVPAVINSNTKNKVPTLTPPPPTTTTLTPPTTTTLTPPTTTLTPLTTTLTPPTTTPTPTRTQSPKTQNNVRNGFKRIPSITKPKKKSYYSKMKEGLKVIRNIAPVRLIPQKSQLTRPQIVNPVNIPGILLPIRDSQNQVGETFVFKNFFSPAPRLQEPTLLAKPVTSVSMPIIAARHPAPLPESEKPYQPPNSPRLQEPTLLAKPVTSVSMPIIVARHPAPLPESEKPYQPPNCKALPPPPVLELSKAKDAIVIAWVIDGYKETKYEEIASYQIYAYQETSLPPSTDLWEKIGDVKALALPMACTLAQFEAGYKYYFAVRAVDVKSRIGPFSLPSGILLLNKM